MKKNILVLGSGGMLGHTVYKYLSQKFENHVFATERSIKNNPRIFTLKAEKIDKDFNAIIQNITDIEYVINCVGGLRGRGDDMFNINSDFPRKLSQLCKMYKIKLIHISTDAVFDPLSGDVNEKDKPNPIDNYGKSKLKGEPNDECCISFRTSIIGFDPKNHKGFLEWVVTSKSKSIAGYINQNWSGCTTLQFAQLCEDIIVHDNFSTLRKISNVFHFVPLGPITKYKLINKFLNIYGLPKSLLKEKGVNVTRRLRSLYSDYFPNKTYTSSINKALKEVLLFEKCNSFHS